MRRRSILAYHYTRMTDDEVTCAVANGLELSTAASLRRRLSARIAAGDFDQNLCDRIYSGTPLHTDGGSSRENRIWLTTLPPPPDHALVEHLLGNWGGESAYWHLKGLPALKIGVPRVFEVALPLAATNGAYSAAEVVVSTYLRSLGEAGDREGLDLCAIKALPPAAIVRVLSEGDRSFQTIGERFLMRR
jgi:hypothetical protein